MQTGGAMDAGGAFKDADSASGASRAVGQLSGGCTAEPILHALDHARDHGGRAAEPARKSPERAGRASRKIRAVGAGESRTARHKVPAGADPRKIVILRLLY